MEKAVTEVYSLRLQLQANKVALPIAPSVNSTTVNSRLKGRKSKGTPGWGMEDATPKWW